VYDTKYSSAPQANATTTTTTTAAAAAATSELMRYVWHCRAKAGLDINAEDKSHLVYDTKYSSAF
jgi:hypothetical protein